MRNDDGKKRYEGLYNTFINDLIFPKELDTLTPKGSLKLIIDISSIMYT